MCAADIHDLATKAPAFRKELNRLKQAAEDVEWYRYDTFAALPVLDSMLTGSFRDLAALAGSGPVLDLGTGDGDLAFFLESAGCDALAVDNPATNCNGGRGFRRLGAALGSSAGLCFCDLDETWPFAGRTFGLAVCLGLLYHLKNPFTVLEKLARHARHAILSTRVAQETTRGTAMAKEPVAYLLSPAETNHDPTNYWIFSETGLKRLLDRTGWDVCASQYTGCSHGSNPTDQRKDQRAFFMLRSKHPDPWVAYDLESGWHAMENGSWRWTERVFSVRLPPGSAGASVLRFCFNLPEALLDRGGPVRLQASIRGEPLPACTYASAGSQIYTQPVPRGLATDASPSLRFELDRAFIPGGGDARELGVQVVFWSYSGSTPEELHPLRIT